MDRYSGGFVFDDTRAEDDSEAQTSGRHDSEVHTSARHERDSAFEDAGESVQGEAFRDGSAFVLTVLRTWSRIASLRRNREDGEELHKYLNIWTRSFCAFGGPQASLHWDRFMTCVAQNARRHIVLGCACCGKVSEDETLVLSAIADIQAMKFDGARQTLAKTLHADAIDQPLHHLLMFCDLLSAQGVQVSEQIVSALADRGYTSRRQMH